jgi:(4S)-4-hydroxy-5-phosphonooxypentane-2,3-dione isomerase
MIVTIVHIWVKPEFLEKFIEASKENHVNSIKEAGNLRFDLLQDAALPNKFVFYEVFDSPQSVQAHKETPHYIKWRDTVSPWMEKPREGIKHIIIAPEEKSLW